MYSDAFFRIIICTFERKKRMEEREENETKRNETMRERDRVKLKAFLFLEERLNDFMYGIAFLSIRIATCNNKAIREKKNH